MILIREVVDVPDYHGYLTACWSSNPTPEEVKIVNQLFVGIDVGSRGNTAYLMRPDGEKYSNFTVQNNRGGAKILIDKIVSALTTMGLEQVVIGMEATGIYGENLAYALREDGTLGRFRRKIHVLNPKQVSKFKESYPELPKNDGVDALKLWTSWLTPIWMNLQLSLIRKGRNFADPAAKAKAIQIAARNSYRLPITVNNSVNQATSVCIATMRALEKQIKVLDKQIEQIFAIIPNTLTSVPGIGKVYSAGIIAEIGDINRFQSQAFVAKYAGLVWKRHQSGEFEAQNTRLIKSGNRFLRYYLLEAANSVRRCDSEFRRYYDLKYKQVNKFQHKRALALIARKLVRLVFRLLKDGRNYIPPEG